ncbi:putative RNA-directed DNA polymerase from transposon BS, partial [Stegodyphus mimosarum]
MFGKPVPIVTTAKYLGVIFNRSFTWTNHISYVCGKAYGIIKRLYPLLAKDSGLSLNRKRRLYTAIVRPIITYAAPTWASATNGDIRKLQILQNKFLRTITNA